jgi:hypothetical protein
MVEPHDDNPLKTGFRASSSEPWYLWQMNQGIWFHGNNERSKNMRNSTSILGLLLGLGILTAGPIFTNFDPFGPSQAYAKGSDNSGSGSDNSGSGSDSDNSGPSDNSGHGGHGGHDDNDDDDHGDDDDDNDNDEGETDDSGCDSPSDVGKPGC